MKRYKRSMRWFIFLKRNKISTSVTQLAKKRGWEDTQTNKIRYIKWDVITNAGVTFKTIIRDYYRKINVKLEILEEMNRFWTHNVSKFSHENVKSPYWPIAKTRFN